MVVNHGLIMCEHQYLANIIVCLNLARGTILLLLIYFDVLLR
jgi:hypothetical protein